VCLKIITMLVENPALQLLITLKFTNTGSIAYTTVFISKLKTSWG
jgi:hypothetical protein